MMKRDEVLNLYFLEARSKLIDLAAFLDRVERSSGEDDFRLHAFRAALQHLSAAEPDKAKAVLTTLSDPTMEPLANAATKGATGAWPQFKG
ncbi:MAG TPA: hypothetical protein VGQ40_08335 [Chthoniobacterales bacterium]|jgi:hypothetical protein|nr:hypothetical protein [Chthoniobacterales bacterium]